MTRKQKQELAWLVVHQVATIAEFWNEYKTQGEGGVLENVPVEDVIEALRVWMKPLPSPWQHKSLGG